jgi:general secretion pathway protein A
LETSEDKLLQVVLVGQPELDEKLDSINLRQLKQRVALRARLDILDQNETKNYIVARLQIAGAKTVTDRLFCEQAITEIYRYSRGIPRVINTICENALITAYARQLRSIGPDIILEVARDFCLEPGPLNSDEINRQATVEIERVTNDILNIYSVQE